MMSIVISSLCAVIFTFFIEEIFLITNSNESDLRLIYILILVIFVSLSVTGLLFYLIIHGIKLFSDKNMKSNFLIDFKEIVDELLTEKVEKR